MRLIDADELPIKYDGHTVSVWKNDINNSPTIDAISVEWLKKHKYSNVVDLWEKECRLKDTKDILDELLSEHNFKSYNDYVEYAGKITALPRDDRLDILFKEKENEQFN